jgi:hypothetical protein
MPDNLGAVGASPLLAAGARRSAHRRSDLPI